MRISSRLAICSPRPPACILTRTRGLCTLRLDHHRHEAPILGSGLGLPGSASSDGTLQSTITTFSISRGAVSCEHHHREKGAQPELRLWGVEMLLLLNSLFCLAPLGLRGREETIGYGNGARDEISTKYRDERVRELRRSQRPIDHELYSNQISTSNRKYEVSIGWLYIRCGNYSLTSSE